MIAISTHCRFAAATLTIVLSVGLGECCTPNPGNNETGSPSSSPYRAAEPGQSAAAAQKKRAVSMPASLTQMGEYGENIYDAAKGKNWKEADTKLAALNQAIQESQPELSKNENERSRLQSTLTALEGAVRKQDSWGAMREANQVTLVAADLTASYHPQVPADVARLDYDGRELEIWSSAKDLAKQRTTAQEMRQNWDRLKPEVEAHNGATESQKFEDLIAQVDHASSVAQYQALAGPVLGEVDNLEKVF